MVTDRSVARPRVVLAEDFVLIQEAVRLAIGRECDLVAAVEDAEAAVHAVEAHLPDVLVLDVSLPGGNGFVVAEKLQQSHPDVKVIFLTAYPDRQYIEKAFAIGAKAYVLKSYIRTELPKAIREVIAGRLYRSTATLDNLRPLPP